MSSLTATPPATIKNLRTPARVLMASLAVFVVFVVLAAATMPTDAHAELTRAKLDDVAVPFVAMHLLWTLAFACGAAGMLLVCRALGDTGDPRITAVRVLSLAALVGFLAYAAIVVPLVTTTAATVADDPWHRVATFLSVALAWLLLVATALLSLVLRARDILTRAGLVLAVVCGIYLLVEVATWLPAFLGSTPYYLGGGLPPFLIGVIWLALGLLLRRRGVSSDA